jgi:hypothetical protein
MIKYDKKQPKIVVKKAKSSFVSKVLGTKNLKAKSDKTVVENRKIRI